MAAKKSIIITQTAQSQRLSILAYWFDRLGHGRYSAVLARDFEHCLDLIQKFPQIGRKIQGTGYLGFTIRDFLIVYELTTNEIVIHQFWDLRQGPTSSVVQ
ncbi:MAG TPA: type II toxin-antitoxin system RelE/ParE family toxin [Turneriella sp.]|nr:type II toxin-antitoxin system RelE/ParE family toxin [Turneriella sp.]HNA79242.1 type II toxin-antitoxin system RelE/ParE family toxin [Turneriella sp.]HNL54118.1 type II toxin-antitoxin system RelE/ParE family toxin [Turneriella sp.]HNN01232.1 type II toxin-antitoxin system RelE/ParE family toxin [Turneriella sp.]